MEGVLQGSLQHSGFVEAIMVEMEQELDLALEAVGVAIHLHPAVVVVGGDPVVLGGDDQLLMVLGVESADPLPGQLHGNKLRMPVDGQDALLAGVDGGRVGNQPLLLRGQLGAGDQLKAALILGADFDSVGGCSQARRLFPFNQFHGIVSLLRSYRTVTWAPSFVSAG